MELHEHQFADKDSVPTCTICNETKDFLDREPQSGEESPTPPPPPKIEIRASGVATPFPYGLHVLMEAASIPGRLSFEHINDIEGVILDWLQSNFPAPSAAPRIITRGNPNPLTSWPNSARSQDVFKSLTMMHILFIDMKMKFSKVCDEAKEIHEALFNLVELKRQKDAPEVMTAEAAIEYEKNKAIAWANAFKLVGPPAQPVNNPAAAANEVPSGAVPGTIEPHSEGNLST